LRRSEKLPSAALKMTWSSRFSTTIRLGGLCVENWNEVGKVDLTGTASPLCERLYRWHGQGRAPRVNPAAGRKRGCTYSCDEPATELSKMIEKSYYINCLPSSEDCSPARKASLSKPCRNSMSR